ncbi:MAG: serine kinase, partial [Chloroflexota bacterium]
SPSACALGTEEASSAGYFQAVFAAFQRAEWVAGDPIDRFYSVGRRSVRLRFAGSGLLPCITPALRHLAAEPSLSPDLTIHLWDSASTGAGAPPPPPWRAEDYLPRGEIRGYQGGSIYIAYLPATGALSMMDAVRHQALYWVPDAARLPYWESAAPLRSILHWWVGDTAYRLAHAAAVGIPSGGALLAGKGGSGKSTTALACLDAGLLYAGDDYVLIGTEPSPYVYSLYGSAKLDGKQAGSFPHLAAAIQNHEKLETEKALLFLHDRYPERLVHGLPIRAILLPRIAGRRETKIQKASTAAALAALAPTTIFQLPLAGRGVFQMIARFAQQLPAYSLELGWDIAAIPTLIADLLAELEKTGEGGI